MLKTLFSKLENALDHNRYTFLGLFVGCVLASVLMFGCQPKVDDPFTEVKDDKISMGELAAKEDQYNIYIAGEVTRIKQEADAELQALETKSTMQQAMVQSAWRDIEHQIEQQNFLIDLGQQVLAASPLGTLAVGGLGLTGIVGLVADNRRKDLLIRQKKEAVSATG